MLTKKEFKEIKDKLKARGGILSNLELDILRKSFYFKAKLVSLNRDFNRVLKYEFDLIDKIEQLSVLLGQVIIINNLYTNVLNNIQIREDSKKLIAKIEDAINTIKKDTPKKDTIVGKDMLLKVEDSILEENKNLIQKIKLNNKE